MQTVERSVMSDPQVPIPAPSPAYLPGFQSPADFDGRPDHHAEGEGGWQFECAYGETCQPGEQPSRWTGRWT